MRLLVLLATALLASAGPTHVVRGTEVEVALSTDRSRYERGEPVFLRLTVRNRGLAPALLEFATAQRYDFRVLQPDGRLVWQWSHDKVFAQVLGTLRLQPQQTRIYTERWDQVDNEGRPVPPGRYVVEGIFPARVSPGWTLLLPHPPRLTLEILARGARDDRAHPEPYRKVFVPGAIRVRFFPWASAEWIERRLQALDLRVVSVEADGRTYVVRTPSPHRTAETVAALNRAVIVEWAVPHYVLVPRREPPTRRP